MRREPKSSVLVSAELLFCPKVNPLAVLNACVIAVEPVDGMGELVGTEARR